MSSYVKGQDTIFKIGDIYNGIDKEKHKKLLEFYLEKEIPKPLDNSDCENCLLNGFCSPGLSCISSLYDLTETAYEYPKVLCRYHQILFKNSLLKVLATAEINNIVFNNNIKTGGD